jgi:hypothetical protein
MMMKRVLIEQFGEEAVRLSRRFYVEIPDDMDVNEFEDYDVCALVEELADEEDLDWEFHESSEVFAAECMVIEPEPDAEGSYSVLKITPEDVAAAKSRLFVPPRVKSVPGFVLQDQNGDLIAGGTEVEMLSHLRDRVPDGFYRIIGLDGIRHYVRQNGVVVPDWDVRTLEEQFDVQDD